MRETNDPADRKKFAEALRTHNRLNKESQEKSVAFRERWFKEIFWTFTKQSCSHAVIAFAKQSCNHAVKSLHYLGFQKNCRFFLSRQIFSI